MIITVGLSVKNGILSVNKAIIKVLLSYMHCYHNTNFLPSWETNEREALDSPCCSQGRSYESGFAGSVLYTVFWKKRGCNVGKPCCRPKLSFNWLLI